MTEPHVGMRVWSFNQNRRIYQRDASGKAVGGPIWREHWEPLVVVGETKVSWLVGPPYMLGSDTSRAAKVPKKSWPGPYKTSEAGIDREAFVEARWSLAQRIEGCRDYDTLKAIEGALDALK
ncbi:MAG: hypothetical protein E6Q97_05490 [Desulfurellales bacterium]|nr:MAG: hypothetical protein E6Q97_05490 [Desulfurellales bacterium]